MAHPVVITSTDIRRIGLFRRVVRLQQSVQASAQEKPQAPDAVQDWRLRADGTFILAVHKSIGAAESHLLKNRAEKKKWDRRKKELLLLLMLMYFNHAARKAYGELLPELERASKPSSEGIKALSSSAEDMPFLDQRLNNLRPFLGKSIDTLAEAADTPTDAMAIEALAKKARSIEANEGRRVAETEAQGILLAAQLRALQNHGYAKKRWVTCNDEKVRESHMQCEAQAPIALTARFQNGLLYPGDPAGSAAETCNCRCWLEGVWK